MVKSSQSTHTSSNDHVKQYGYDSKRDYLMGVSYDGGSTHQTWTYDAAGNRTSDSGNSGTWAYDNLNRMTASPGVSSYNNDILGNRTQATITGGNKTYSWDCLNRMTAYNGVWPALKTYTYRADGMRVAKADPSTPSTHTDYAYDGQMPFEEYYYQAAYPSFTSIKFIRYGLGARGIDRIERDTNGAGTLVGYPVYDSHGNDVATLMKGSNNSCSLSDQRGFDAWGQVRTGNTTGEPMPRHCASLGHLQDDESGLVYMRARYYEPGTGRFISQDSNTDGPNWYLYCGNEPLNRIDTTGKSWLFFVCGFLTGLLVALEVAWHEGELGSKPLGFYVYAALAHSCALLGAEFAFTKWSSLPNLTKGLATVAGGLLGLALFVVGLYVAKLALMMMDEIFDNINNGGFYRYQPWPEFP